LIVVTGFVGGWGDERSTSGQDLAVAASVVELVYVFEGGEVDVCEA